MGSLIENTIIALIVNILLLITGCTNPFIALLVFTISVLVFTISDMIRNRH